MMYSTQDLANSLARDGWSASDTADVCAAMQRGGSVALVTYAGESVKRSCSIRSMKIACWLRARAVAVPANASAQPGTGP